MMHQEIATINFVSGSPRWGPLVVGQLHQIDVSKQHLDLQGLELRICELLQWDKALLKVRNTSRRPFEERMWPRNIGFGCQFVTILLWGWAPLENKKKKKDRKKENGIRFMQNLQNILSSVLIHQGSLQPNNGLNYLLNNTAFGITQQKEITR